MSLTSLLHLERSLDLGEAVTSPRLHHQLSPMEVEQELSLSPKVLRPLQPPSPLPRS